jgi:hypothetical protein
MKKLWVYGDSFSASETNSWTTRLSKNLGLVLDNKAISGGSTENAIKQFIRDVSNNRIKDNDVVIFQTSTPGRLHFEFQDQRPETAVEYLREPQSDGDHTWYRINKKHIEWWMVNQDHEVMNINQLGYISLVKNIATAMPNVTFVCLSNSNVPNNNLGGPNPENFLISYTYLFDISLNEIILDEPIKNELHSYWTSYTKFDPRTNHLTNPNLQILADVLAEAITNMDISNLTYDKFQQKIAKKITSKDQYLKDCDVGLYTFNQWSIDNMGH